MPHGTRSNGLRAAVRVSPRLDKSLVAYVAAGAAGAALISAAQPAEAKVIYTATNITITDTTSIDLNGDGIADFVIAFHRPYRTNLLSVKPQVTGNGIRPAHPSGAQAGFAGTPVGHNAKFATSSGSGWGLNMAAAGTYGTKYFFGGPWANTTDRYLGLKFVIRGRIHYGWARLSVSNFNRGGAAVLTGYAFETVRNTPIKEGATGASTNITGIEPVALVEHYARPAATLGLLARGADGLALWRRDEDPVAYRRDDVLA